MSDDMAAAMLDYNKRSYNIDNFNIGVSTVLCRSTYPSFCITNITF